MRDLIVGQGATLWLGRWPVGRTRSWLILDDRGSPRGQLDLPAARRVQAASATRLLGILPDHDGIPSIMRYRVVGAPPK